jgi:putative endonuclease
MYTVYVINSEKLLKYYIGYTSDLPGRPQKHNRNSKGFSSAGRPWILVYREEYTSEKEAMMRENQLKGSKNRNRLIELFSKGSEHPD